MFVALTVAKQLTEVHILYDSQVASLADGLKIKYNIPVASTVEAKKLTELPKLADSQVASLSDDSLKIKNNISVALIVPK